MPDSLKFTYDKRLWVRRNKRVKSFKVLIELLSKNLDRQLEDYDQFAEPFILDNKYCQEMDAATREFIAPKLQEAEDEGKKETDIIQVKTNISYTVAEMRYHVQDSHNRFKTAQIVQVLPVASSFNYLISLFDATLADLVKELLEKCPGLLIGENIKEETPILKTLLFNATRIEEIINPIIEDKLYKFGMSSISDQVKELTKWLKHTIIPAWIDVEEIEEMRETRNLFTHTNGIVGNRYLQRIKNPEFTKDEFRIIDKQYFEKCANICIQVLEQISALIVKAHNLANNITNTLGTELPTQPN